MFRFEELEIWKKGIEFSDGLLDLADSLSEKKLYRFAEQLMGAPLEISPLRSQISPKGLTGPMALRNPASARIASLLPMNPEDFRDFKLPLHLSNS